MSKNEFLKELRDYLTGQISASEVEESVRYYDQYIRDQAAGGMSEEEAVESLGDPRIIGRSIVDAAARKKADGGASRSASFQGQRDTSSSRTPQKGSSSRGTVNSGKLKFYGTLAIILLVIIVILVAITRIIAFFFPLIIVVLLVTYVMKHWGDGR